MRRTPKTRPNVKMTQEEDDQLMQTLSRQEKELQEDLKKKKHKPVRVKIEKDW